MMNDKPGAPLFRFRFIVRSSSPIVGDPMERTNLWAGTILGAWLAVTVCMWFAATASFGTVRRVLEGGNPGLAETVKPLTPDRTRVALRHLASEMNRTYFGAYGWAQLVLGAGFLILLFRQTPRDPTALIIVGAMVAVVAALTFYVTPEVMPSAGESISCRAIPPRPRCGASGCCMERSRCSTG